jgi:hypothetical protein
MEIAASERFEKRKVAEQTDFIESVTFVRNFNGQRFRFTASGEDARKWGILILHRSHFHRGDVEELSPKLKREELTNL